MSRTKEYRAARNALDDATASLLTRAANYPGLDHSDRTRDILRAAREYARALARAETMRTRK